VGKLELLVERYEKFCAIPWEKSLAGPQRVWFVVYDPSEERRIRLRMPEFEVATKKAGHGWASVDLTDSFGHWLGKQDYLSSYLECPDDLDPILPGFEAELAQQVQTQLEAADDNSILAISGVGGLFGLTSVAGLVHQVAPVIKGRLVVFFPGTHVNNNYKLLGGRPGWNYLAVAISAHDGGDDS